MLSRPSSTQFSKPEDYLAAADPAMVGAIIASASDIALIIDLDDTVRDSAVGAEGIDGADFADWLGQPLENIVTVESRPKVAELVAAARRGEVPRWRELNHPMPAGEDDFPVRYCAVKADPSGRVMLLGRDLRPVAALQRRLVGIQQSLDRDYTRLLQMETRYRLLFQSATEAFLIVDSATARIIEVNAATAQLFGQSADEIARKKFPTGFDAASTKALSAAIAAVRASGRPETLSVTLAEGGPAVDAFLSLYRVENGKHLLIRLSPATLKSLSTTETEAQIVDLFRRACEAIVLTDSEARIEWANDAFLDLVQVAVETQVVGERLDTYFTRPGIDLPLILSNTRESGRLRFYATSLSGQHGIASDVEVSGVSLSDGGRDGFGFIFRNAALRPVSSAASQSPLPRSPEQLTELIGRVPLKDLVRETVDVIERLCIEAALRMTDDNRASAADLLGLSRQSLYVKLRRYGLSEPSGDDG
ncbi:MAG: transcriptional regulator PpsR [Pikeienuella sp.]